MSNRKATKRALLTSVMALALCVVMLVGTTFAWFTDTAKTNVNKIQAGNLDVELYYADNATGENAEWALLDNNSPALNFLQMNGEEAIQSETILWEPGCTYSLPALKVVNNGNLNLKYRVEITGINGDAKLNKVIDWTIGNDGTPITEGGIEYALNAKNGDEVDYDIITISGTMDKNAGNEYQNLSIDGASITVYATQMTGEFDSFRNDYDKDAKYTVGQVFTSGTHELSGGVKVIDPNGVAVTASGAETNVTITGGTYDGGAGGNNKCIQVENGATVTIKDGTFTVGADAEGTGNSVVECWGGNVIIEGGFFYTNYNWNGFYYVLNQKNNNPGTITVKGGTFVNYNPATGDDNLGGDFVADGYSVIYETKANGDVWYTVVKEGAGVLPTEQEDLNSGITNSAEKNVTVVMPENSSFTLDNGIANEGAKSRNVTFKGDGTQTMDVITKSVSAEGGMLNYQRGSTFTFENVTIQAGEGSFDGIVCDELVYKNCTIKGKLTLYGKATFINCTFENNMNDQYSIWTWGGTDVTFEGCTFNTNGKAILLYGQATAAKPTNLTVNNCVFNDRKGGAAGKAAIEIGNDYNATYNLVVNNITVNGFTDGKNTGSKIWANKNSMVAAHLSVTIDGTKVL